MKIKFALINILFFSCSIDIYTQNGYYKYSLTNFRECKEFVDTIDLEHPDPEILNAVLFFLTNEKRVENGQKELGYDPRLEKSAQLHSTCMVSDDFFDHINPKTKKMREPNDRARYAGISNPKLAENIIEGFLLRYTENVPVIYEGPGIFRYKPEDDPIEAHTYLSLGEVLMERWMKSLKHRENILSSHAVQLGCGTAFFMKEELYGMPAVMATQNFQFYESILPVR
jgi:uncharacterized protein YkwD